VRGGGRGREGLGEDEACAVVLDMGELAPGLARIGLVLGDEAEESRLVHILDPCGRGGVSFHRFVSALLDWSSIQGLSSLWQQAALAAFEAADKDRDGLIDKEALVPLPTDEAGLQRAVVHAMSESPALHKPLSVSGRKRSYSYLADRIGHAAQEDAAGMMDFDQFVRMLRVGSLDNLENYESRAASRASKGDS